VTERPRIRRPHVRRLLIIAVFSLGGCQKSETGSVTTLPARCDISGVNTTLFQSGTVGEAVNIRWIQNGVPATVRLELLLGGAVVDTIATAAANIGFFPWVADIGDRVGGSDFGIRVSGNGVPDCQDEVNGLTIINISGCSLTYTANRDTVWAGQNFDLTWDRYHTSPAVDLELWTTAFGNVLDELAGTIATGVPNTGSYIWVADSFNRGTYDFYRIVLRDAISPACADTSLAFAMIDETNCTVTVSGVGPSVPLSLGDSVLIMIDQVNGSGLVDLRLYAGNVFVSGGFIADNVPVANSFTWVVDDFGFQLSPNNYRIRAIDANDRYCVGMSDRFTINSP